MTVPLSVQVPRTLAPPGIRRAVRGPRGSAANGARARRRGRAHRCGAHGNTQKGKAKMKLQQLRILLAVAQHGSIHEASRSLHVSQPALSKAIAELERELGVTLMSRSVRGISLTAYGVA